MTASTSNIGTEAIVITVVQSSFTRVHIRYPFVPAVLGFLSSVWLTNFVVLTYAHRRLYWRTFSGTGRSQLSRLLIHLSCMVGNFVHLEPIPRLKALGRSTFLTWAQSIEWFLLVARLEHHLVTRSQRYGVLCYRKDVWKHNTNRRVKTGLHIHVIGLQWASLPVVNRWNRCYGADITHEEIKRVI